MSAKLDIFKKYDCGGVNSEYFVAFLPRIRYFGLMFNTCSEIFRLLHACTVSFSVSEVAGAVCTQLCDYSAAFHLP